MQHAAFCCAIVCCCMTRNVLHSGHNKSHHQIENSSHTVLLSNNERSGVPYNMHRRGRSVGVPANCQVLFGLLCLILWARPERADTLPYNGYQVPHRGTPREIYSSCNIDVIVPLLALMSRTPERANRHRRRLRRRVICTSIHLCSRP